MTIGICPATCGTISHHTTNLETDLPTIAQLEVELARLDDAEVRTIISRGGTS